MSVRRVPETIAEHYRRKSIRDFVGTLVRSGMCAHSEFGCTRCYPRPKESVTRDSSRDSAARVSLKNPRYRQSSRITGRRKETDTRPANLAGNVIPGADARSNPV
jgi:hypothetical protein